MNCGWSGSSAELKYDKVLLYCLRKGKGLAAHETGIQYFVKDKDWPKVRWRLASITERQKEKGWPKLRQGAALKDGTPWHHYREQVEQQLFEKQQNDFC